MLTRLCVFGISLLLSHTASANEKFMINFELLQGKTQLEQGSLPTSKKLVGWNKGRQKSYLRLSCNQQDNGNAEKLLSTIDLFDGLKITQKTLGDLIELTVVFNKVTSSNLAIRALDKNECVELAPTVDTITETYRFVAHKGLEQDQPFGQFMTFKSSIK